MSKKTTTKKETEQTKTVSENELTFLLYNSGKSTGNAELAQAALAKTNTQTKLVIVDETNINDWHTNAGNTIYVVDDTSGFNPQAVLAVFAQNKKTFNDANAVYAGVFNKQSGKSPLGLLQKIGIGFYNLIGGMLLPAGISDYSHNFIFFGKDAAAEAFSKSNNTSIALLNALAYRNKNIVSFTLSSKEFSQRKTSWGKIFANVFSSRINWFITEPLNHFNREDEANRQPLYRLLFAGLFVFALFALPYFSQDFGITWDAVRHNEYGYQMLNYFTSMGNDTTALAANSSIQEFRYYGEHFNVISAFFNTYIKILGEYETRHLLNSLYGLLAMLFGALAVKEISSWRGAFFGLLLILCSPVFFAHSMNNPTDIPFAAGSAMALYYLLKVLKKLPTPNFSHVILLGVGVGIAIGSRVGGILWYAYAGMFLGISWLGIAKKNGMSNAMKLIFPYAKILLLIVVAGHLVGISLWPFAQQKPLTNWYVALKQSTEGAYFTYNHELFEGVRMYMANVPWYYLPKFIFINSPEVVWIGVALLLLTFFAWKKLFNNWQLVLVVLFVTVFPIVYANVQGMYYYNGWRHYLFVYPPVIVLAATGWDGVTNLIKNKKLQHITCIVVTILCALPVSWMLKNHPNECVYFNHISGGTRAAYGEYEMDYYSNSCRAAAEWLAKQEPNKKLIVGINNKPETGAYYANKTNPNMEFRWMREYEEQKLNWDYAILTSRTFSSKELKEGSFPPKGTVFTVDADGVPIAAVVKRENDFMPLGYQYFEARNFDSAVIYFTQATQYNPKDEEAFRMLGMAYMNLGNKEEAVKNLNKSIEIFPENYMAYIQLGLVETQLNQNLDKGIEYFKKANEYKFNQTEAYYYTGMAYYQKGDFQKGVKYFEYGKERGGSSVPDIYYNIALGQYNLGSYKKAEENLMYALAINQNSATYYRLLAEVFLKQNKQQEAQVCMERYKALGGQ